MAAKLAIKEGYNWLLTMDQDSRASDKMLSIMYEFINSHNIKDVGIIAPYPLNKFEVRADKKFNFQYEFLVITSGNLLNLNIYGKIGGFLNKLFIDQVDFEYCLRLHFNNYKIIKLNKALLYHNSGNLRCVKYGIYLYDRECFRSYYIIRNTLYILKKYKNIFPHWYIESKNYLIYKEIINVLIYENNRLRKLLYMIRGYLDYKCNRFGKYEKLLKM